jgi:LysM repeat protein
MRLRFLILISFILFLVIINPIPVPSASGFGDVPPQSNVTPISPVIVSTPNSTGAIYHIVQYGQTLEVIAVAYGISIAELRTLNGLAEGASDIYIGQSLIIRVSQPPTETPTLTPTTPPPTRTPRSITPIMTPTPFPTATATPRSLIPHGVIFQRKSAGIILVSIGAAGLIAMALHYWISNKKRQP